MAITGKLAHTSSLPSFLAFLPFLISPFSTHPLLCPILTSKGTAPPVSHNLPRALLRPLPPRHLHPRRTPITMMSTITTMTTASRSRRRRASRMETIGIVLVALRSRRLNLQFRRRVRRVALRLGPVRLRPRVIFLGRRRDWVRGVFGWGWGLWVRCCCRLLSLRMCCGRLLVLRSRYYWEAGKAIRLTSYIGVFSFLA